jgi:hypothetical protein
MQLKVIEMACNSDYMAANGKEIQLSRVACLLDELATTREFIAKMLMRMQWFLNCAKSYRQLMFQNVA